MRLTRTVLIAAAALAAAILVGQAAAQPAPPDHGQASGALPDWADYMEAMKPIGEKAISQTAHPDNPRNRQETWRMLMGIFVQQYLRTVYNDSNYPEFTPLYNTAINYAAPNPDYVYLGTPVDGGGVYRLRGLIGTNRFTDLQINSAPKDGSPGRAVGVYDLADAHPDSSGSFDVLLSATRPAGYSGTWWRLDPTAGGLFFRVASYDWIHERDPVVSIERLDVPAGRPRLSAEEQARRTMDMVKEIDGSGGRWWRRVAEMHADKLENRIAFHDWGPGGGYPSDVQVYMEGLYKLKDDEALIIETDIPKTCRYWSFLVGDDQFGTVDWMHHQSSLNGFQARLDSDGKFRAVIARTDPGVPNWLDTGGFAEGIIQGRWNRCDSKPLPTAHLVKLADLRNYLPAGTPVVTPEERDRQMRDRRMGAQFRRKW